MIYKYLVPFCPFRATSRASCTYHMHQIHYSRKPFKCCHTINFIYHNNTINYLVEDTDFIKFYIVNLEM